MEIGTHWPEKSSGKSFNSMYRLMAYPLFVRVHHDYDF